MEVIRILYFLTLFGLSLLILQQIQIFLHGLLPTALLATTQETISFHEISVVNHVSDKFLSVTLEANIFRHRHKSKRFHFGSQKMKTLAEALAPSYVRLGGTDCDFLIFNMTQDTTLRFKSLQNGDDNYDVNYGFGYNEDYEDKIEKNFSMTLDDWDKLNIFVEKVGWDLIFDLNVFLRKDGKWDPTNAIELFKYTVQQGYKPAGYELGNEPDLFPSQFPTHVITAPLLAKDYLILASVLNSSRLPQYFITGPETAGLYRNFFQMFLGSFGANVDIATFHHYYLNSRTATVEQFHDPSVLDSLKQQVIAAVNITSYHRNIPCWLGETSSSYGGGAAGISDRYVAGFLWLDKLGISALYGLQGVMRQSFYGGNYALIDKYLNPNPDYWLTVLYKRLVGRTVLNIKPSSNPNLRVYAHCTNTNSSMGYYLGSVTVYVMNLGSETISLDFTGVKQTARHLYLLSPGDENGLTSPFVKLNGEVLKLVSDTQLPTFTPNIQEGTVELEGFNMGYIVLPNAKFIMCI